MQRLGGGSPGAQVISNDELLALDVGILIPARLGFQTVDGTARRYRVTNHKGAYVVAVSRVPEACQLRGWSERLTRRAFGGKIASR